MTTRLRVTQEVEVITEGIHCGKPGRVLCPRWFSWPPGGGCSFFGKLGRDDGGTLRADQCLEAEKEAGK